jgi:hypothetical protein
VGVEGGVVGEEVDEVDEEKRRLLGDMAESEGEDVEARCVVASDERSKKELGRVDRGRAKGGEDKLRDELRSRWGQMSVQERLQQIGQYCWRQAVECREREGGDKEEAFDRRGNSGQRFTRGSRSMSALEGDAREMYASRARRVWEKRPLWGESMARERAWWMKSCLGGV